MSYRTLLRPTHRDTLELHGLYLAGSACCGVDADHVQFYLAFDHHETLYESRRARALHDLAAFHTESLVRTQLAFEQFGDWPGLLIRQSNSELLQDQGGFAP